MFFVMTTERREEVQGESTLLTGCKMMLSFAAPTAQASMERERKDERARARERKRECAKGRV